MVDNVRIHITEDNNSFELPGARLLKSDQVRRLLAENPEYVVSRKSVDEVRETAQTYATECDAGSRGFTQDTRQSLNQLATMYLAVQEADGSYESKRYISERDKLVAELQKDVHHLANELSAREAILDRILERQWAHLTQGAPRRRLTYTELTELL